MRSIFPTGGTFPPHLLTVVIFLIILIFTGLPGRGDRLAALPDEKPGRTTPLPDLPFGAVYFRKSNPPPEDWERDYRQAAADGMNCFRHWLLWSAIEVSPGEYDWRDYDRQLDLAARHGIRTILADILCAAPEWAFRKYPHARVENADGTRESSQYVIACAVGGWPGLCLDNEEVRQKAEQFLTAVVERYRDHPALAGYDAWNELNHFGDAGGCFCEASAEKFREWLREKYGSLEALGRAWLRYSYSNWEDIQPPRTLAPYPDSLDWARFRIDNALRLFRWRVELIRGLDPQHPVTAHAIPMGAIRELGPASYPVFQAGKLVDIYGYSGGCNHEEWSELRWQHWIKMDLTRSASSGKPFWAAEMPAGASWRARRLTLEGGRVTTPQDLRLYTLTHLAGGARGIFSPRWRPLLDGPLAGSFGFYDLDGSPTDRSRKASELARWTNSEALEKAREARPVRGEIGILLVPESQIFTHASTESTDLYYRSVSGAYRALLFQNLQPDFVWIDDLGPEHDLLYLPHPVMLSSDTARRITSWVKGGGKLISEGCPGYFGDGGRVGERQPNLGLDEVFGARQASIVLAPDLLEDLRFRIEGSRPVRGGVYLQTYEPTTGTARGTLEDGRVIVVDHEFGKGQTRLVGTFPGYGFTRKADAGTRQFFGDLLEWAGKTPHVKSSDPRLLARLQKGKGTRFLWVVNSTREDRPTRLELAPRHGALSGARNLSGKTPIDVQGRSMSLEVPARDVVLLELLD